METLYYALLSVFILANLAMNATVIYDLWRGFKIRKPHPKTVNWTFGITCATASLLFLIYYGGGLNQ